MNATLHHVNVTVPRSLEAAAKHFYGVVMGLQEVPSRRRRAGVAERGISSVRCSCISQLKIWKARR